MYLRSVRPSTIFVIAIAAFNQSLSSKVIARGLSDLGWTLPLGRSVKGRFADRKQGEFVVAAPRALASDTPLVEVKALLRFGSPYFPRSHGEREHRLSCAGSCGSSGFPVGRCVAVPVRAPAAAAAQGSRNSTGGSRPPN